ncbi:hypothetical protein [Halorussus litoreus]|uniref:hypothetical protein n=1 Tax=Halorussus litoreus TaxID=1710536 RepID=UPI001300A2B9|nr:hypothetical protein [Halorussus litoreus]
MSETPELEILSEPSVFLHRNNPAVPSSTSSKLTKEGIGIVDWGMGLSWEYSEASDKRVDNAQTALETILSLNQNGGYGVIHTVGYEDVVIGRAEPPCIRFLELEDTNGQIRFFKGFELEEFASVDIRNDFPDLHQRMVDRASHGTTVPVKKDYRHLVTDAFVDLDLDGKLG